MHFLAPLWLALLVPWLALTVWLWRRQVKHAAITGRFLWPESGSRSTSDSERSTPPAWILLALSALLALILALAAPIVLASRARLTVIVDSHASMGLHVGDETVLGRLLNELDADLRGVGGVEVSYVSAMKADALSRDGISRMQLTGEPTRDAIETRCDPIADEAVVVLSAQPLSLPASVIRYAPAGEIADVRVTRFAATVEPSPQVMLTFAHPAGVAPFDVWIGRDVRHRIAPEAGATSTTRFFDLGSAEEEAIVARIEGARSAPGFDRAWLARVGAWPRIEITGDVPIAVERFAAVYATARRADARSKVVRLTSTLDDTAPAICVARAGSPIEPRTVSLPAPGIVQHANFAARVLAIADVAPEGLETLLKVEGKPIVAVERSKRQVWIGFDLAELARTPDWVRWMNALVGFASENDRPRWESTGVDAPRQDWRPVDVDDRLDAPPGVYRTATGELRAAAVASLSLATDDAATRRSLRTAIEQSRRDRAVAVQPFLFGAAMAFALLSGVLLGGRRD